MNPALGFTIALALFTAGVGALLVASCMREHSRNIESLRTSIATMTPATPDLHKAVEQLVKPSEDKIPCLHCNGSGFSKKTTPAPFLRALAVGVANEMEKIKTEIEQPERGEGPGRLKGTGQQAKGKW